MREHTTTTHTCLVRPIGVLLLGVAAFPSPGRAQCCSTVEEVAALTGMGIVGVAAAGLAMGRVNGGFASLKPKAIAFPLVPIVAAGVSVIAHVHADGGDSQRKSLNGAYVGTAAGALGGALWDLLLHDDALGVTAGILIGATTGMIVGSAIARNGAWEWDRASVGSAVGVLAGLSGYKGNVLENVVLGFLVGGSIGGTVSF